MLNTLIHSAHEKAMQCKDAVDKRPKLYKNVNSSCTRGFLKINEDSVPRASSNALTHLSTSVNKCEAWRQS